MTDRAEKMRPRVLHFVTGGFSGATQVALDVCLAHLASGRFAPLLVLRRKRNTDAARVAALRARGLDVRTVPGWAHAATVLALARICRAWRPDILVAHGYSEHLWGRHAGLLAGVARLVHVEHNARERYGPLRLAQALWLQGRSSATIAVSEGVRQSLLARGFAAEGMHTIANGIDTMPWQAEPAPLAQRPVDLMMPARFCRQKDHATLLHALALLRQRGLTPRLVLAGGGKARWQQHARRLCAQLGLQGQVQFPGLCSDMPALLGRTRVCVLSTHYEGMPLALLEGMAAGCAVVASRVPGVEEVLAPGEDAQPCGLLSDVASPASLADALQAALQGGDAMQRMAGRGRARALTHYSRQRMLRDYETLLAALMMPAGA